MNLTKEQLLYFKNNRAKLHISIDGMDTIFDMALELVELKEKQKIEEDCCGSSEGDAVDLLNKQFVLAMTKNSQLKAQLKRANELENIIKAADEFIEYVRDEYGYKLEKEGRYKTLITIYDQRIIEYEFPSPKNKGDTNG